MESKTAIKILLCLKDMQDAIKYATSTPDAGRAGWIELSALQI
jgi:hypothetical protein